MNYRYTGRVLPNRQGHTRADNGVTRIVNRGQTFFALLILLFIGLGRTSECRANDLPEPILDVFPDSQAPTFYETKSNLELQRSFQPWARNSNWHPELDEKSVFHARLQHKSVDERCWEIGIGNGGQMYSICSSFGEAMPPQSPQSQWMDEAWQFTTIYGHLLGRDLPQQKQRFGNAFVHQSGIYTRDKDTKPFYSPILATRFDAERRAYSLVSWGQIPDASVNRSGILVYVQYRDLGAGVIEVTYVIYNFENEPMSNPSGQYFITADPYAECEREPFENPFPPDDPKHKKYENRTVYRAYTRKTDWIELLGFVMPKTESDAASVPSMPLSSIPGIAEVFQAGEKAEASAIMVRK